MNRIVGYVALALFVLTVWAANWAVARYHAVPVGFGLTAPAGVWFVGFAFTLRDIAHHELGRRWIFIGIIFGSLLAYLVEAGGTIPGGLVPLAVASGVAFLVSETADLLVYEPTRERGWLPAVVASNIVGIVVDSMLFLWLAFGSWSYLRGQIVGKAWMTVAAILVLTVVNRRRVVIA